jgi:hypothetical protein
MSMPGFSAEASVYRQNGHYYTTSNWASAISWGLRVAGTCTCSDPGCDNPTCTCSCPQQDPCDARCGGISDNCKQRQCYCTCYGGKWQRCDQAPCYYCCGTSNVP